MVLSEINQYIFEAEICKNTKERIQLEDKFKNLTKKYQKPKLGGKPKEKDKENEEKSIVNPKYLKEKVKASLTQIK